VGVKVKNQHEPVFAISVAKRLTGLTERQIRYWEAQELVAPVRTPGNHRLYSQADIDALVWAARLRRRGYRLWDILAMQKERALAPQLRHESDAHFRFRKPAVSSTPGTPTGQRADRPVTEDRVKLLEEIERRRAEMSDGRREERRN
jgi:DNA-binding transcriptional MerR regulator